MELSKQAREELKEALRTNIGDAVNSFSEEELNQCGTFILTVMVNSLKIRARQSQNNNYGK